MSGRVIDIFAAGCPVCEDTVQMVRQAACPSCEVVVRDMNDSEVAAGARVLGVRSVPAVAVNGVLVACCAESAPDLDSLKAAGLGHPL